MEPGIHGRHNAREFFQCHLEQPRICGRGEVCCSSSRAGLDFRLLGKSSHREASDSVMCVLLTGDPIAHAQNLLWRMRSSSVVGYASLPVENVVCSASLHNTSQFNFTVHLTMTILLIFCT